MATIRPIDNLNNYAMHMVKSTIKDEPYKTTYIRNFLKTANDNKLQGPAVVSLYTAIRNMGKEIGSKDEFLNNRLKNVISLISDETQKISELKDQVMEFALGLVKNYDHPVREGKNNSLGKRLLLAKVGAVRSDRVEPKSWFKKMHVRLATFCKLDE